jgi:hypothetical protein
VARKLTGAQLSTQPESIHQAAQRLLGQRELGCGPGVSARFSSGTSDGLDEVFHLQGFPHKVTAVFIGTVPQQTAYSGNLGHEQDLSVSPPQPRQSTARTDESLASYWDRREEVSQVKGTGVEQQPRYCLEIEGRIRKTCASRERVSPNWNHVADGDRPTPRP